MAESLEDEVIVYARLVKGRRCDGCPVPAADGFIFALYGTTSLDAFIKQLEIPEDIAKRLADDKDLRSNFYATPMPFDNEVDLKILPVKKIHVGDFTCPHRCVEAVDSHMNIYKFELNIHRIELSERLSRESCKRPNKTRKQERPKRYEDIPGPELLEHMIRTYVAPLVRAVMTGVGNRTKLRQDFAAFGTGSLVFQDIVGLCKAIQDHPTDTALTDAYIGKIVSIRNERYEEAARYSAIIKQFKERKPA